MKIVLTGERSRDIQGIITNAFPERSFDFSSVTTIESCLQLLRTDDTVNMVFSDQILPDGTALGLLAHPAVKNRTSSLKVLVVCTESTAVEERQMLEVGATDVLNLSTTHSALLVKLSKVLADGRQTVLAVDDDEDVLDLICTVIELEDLNVITASRGERAVELLKVNYVDAVVSDIVMPGMTGIELLALVRELYPGIPVILVSGHPGKYRPEEVILSGAAAYVRKPFRNSDLIDTLRKALASHPQSSGGSHCLSQGSATPVLKSGAK